MEDAYNIGVVRACWNIKCSSKLYSTIDFLNLLKSLPYTCVLSCNHWQSPPNYKIKINVMARSSLKYLSFFSYSILLTEQSPCLLTEPSVFDSQWRQSVMLQQPNKSTTWKTTFKNLSIVGWDWNNCLLMPKLSAKLY